MMIILGLQKDVGFLQWSRFIHKLNDLIFVLTNLTGKIESVTFYVRCQFRNINYNLRSTRPLIQEIDNRDYMYQECSPAETS